MDIETALQTRSSLAQALYCPTRGTDILCPQDSSNESEITQAPIASQPTPLSSTSRAFKKQCFAETNPIELPPGHPTVALNQEQITSIHQIVANESARAFFGQ